MRLAGIAVSSGIAFGEAVVYNPFDNSMDYRLLPLAKIPQELNKLTQALQRLCQQLQTSLDKLTEDSDNFQLVEADLLLLEDAELIQQIRESIGGLQFSATAAVERSLPTRPVNLKRWKTLILQTGPRTYAASADDLSAVSTVPMPMAWINSNMTPSCWPRI